MVHSKIVTRRMCLLGEPSMYQQALHSKWLSANSLFYHLANKLLKKGGIMENASNA